MVPTKKRQQIEGMASCRLGDYSFTQQAREATHLDFDFIRRAVHRTLSAFLLHASVRQERANERTKTGACSWPQRINIGCMHNTLSVFRTLFCTPFLARWNNHTIIPCTTLTTSCYESCASCTRFLGVYGCDCTCREAKAREPLYSQK